MLTLDEAIKHCHKKAKELYDEAMFVHANPNDEKLDDCIECANEHEQLAGWLEELEARREADKWIPVSERTPDDLKPVNITWINHDPTPYYKEIKDKPFTATGVYFNGQWYWWSTTCEDILAAFSHNSDDIIDKDIEVTAWKPLPEEYKGENT